MTTSMLFHLMNTAMLYLSSKSNATDMKKWYSLDLINDFNLHALCIFLYPVCSCSVYVFLFEMFESGTCGKSIEYCQEDGTCKCLVFQKLCCKVLNIRM